MNSPASESLFARLFTIELDRLTPSEQTILRIASWFCWIFVPLVTLWVAASTFEDIRTYPGVDLRNRVVGARVMLAGYDPYTFVWQADMPEQWLDPVYDAKAHRLTASPPTLLLYAAIAPFSYPTQRLVSFVCEWLALCASLALLTRSLRDVRQRIVFLLGATLFVTATDVWRLHVERGQMYVFHLLALSAAIAWSRRGPRSQAQPGNEMAAGIAFGVLALMRPNLLVIAPALLILRQWRSGSAMLTTVGVGVAATMLLLPISSWHSYLAVGDQYFRAIQDPQSLPDLPRPLREGPVEGVQFGTSLPNVESGSFAMLYRTLHDRFAWPGIDLALASKLVLAGLAALLLALMWRRRGETPRSQAEPGNEAFALMVVLSLDTEFFLPHRWGYADVMLLAPLALLLPALLRSRLAFGVVLLGCLSGSLGQAFFGLYATTVLRSWLVMGALTALAISEPRTE